MKNRTQLVESEIYAFIFEIKIKLERAKKMIPAKIPELKNDFIQSTGLQEKSWDLIYDFPPIKEQRDFDSLIQSLQKNLYL